MTKLSTILVLCLILISARMLPALSAQADVIALENLWIKAELHHDPAALGRLMSDDLVMTEPDGSVISKTEEIAFTADPDAHLDVLESHDMKVLVHGDAAVVTAAYHEKGAYHGKPFEHLGRFTDTWIRYGGTWQCIAAHFSVSVKE